MHHDICTLNQPKVAGISGLKCLYPFANYFQQNYVLSCIKASDTNKTV